MERIYHIDSRQNTVKTISFFDSDDLLIYYHISLPKLEKIGKFGKDFIFKVKHYDNIGFQMKTGKKYYGDFIIAGIKDNTLISPNLSIMEIHYNIHFFAQPALELARILRKNGYSIEDNINITVKGRKITVFAGMLLRSLKIYPISRNLEILDVIFKYKNNLLDMDEVFEKIYIIVNHYHREMQEIDLQPTPRCYSR